MFIPKRSLVVSLSFPTLTTAALRPLSASWFGIGWLALPSNLSYDGFNANQDQRVNQLNMQLLKDTEQNGF